MALETGSYISDLVTTNPTATDLKNQGDDHIRLLKTTIKATFPNVTGAVTPTHTELNYVDGVTSAIQTQLDAKAPINSPTFTGTVAGITSAMVGLGNVDNTSDATKNAATATLTNKTLTTPVLANPSYSGTTANGGTVTTIDINGGTIDGTVIGGSTPAAVSATTLSATGGVTSSKNSDAVIAKSSGTLSTTGTTWFSLQDTIERGYFGYGDGDGSLNVANLIGPVDVVVTGGASVARFSTTGLSVTGALSATGGLDVSTGNTLALQGATSAAGTGIAFPATQLASSNANTFDDYEEGTFTPTLTFGGASVGITYGTQLGSYTKKAREVTVLVSIILTAKGSSTGVAQVTGLPFVTANVAGNNGGAFGAVANMTGLTGALLAQLAANTSTINLQQLGATGATGITDAVFTNTSNLQFTATYFV